MGVIWRLGSVLVNLLALFLAAEFLFRFRKGVLRRSTFKAFRVLRSQ
jgi:hypothetical protein